MSHRKASMTMADLEAIHENRVTVSVANDETAHAEIFEELCEEVEKDDLADQPKPCRRRSLSDDLDAIEAPAHKLQYQRRHSSYEPTARQVHRKEHFEFKEYFQTLQDKHSYRRASFVNNLLEFNLSVDVSSFSETMSSPAAMHMHLSCPVLSYMNDEEEDSVELTQMKRPSLTYVGDDSLESWESLKDDGETTLPADGHEESREYIIELPPMEDPVNTTKPRRRKSHSYKVLEQKLAESSPMEVLRSMNIQLFPTAPYNAAAATAPAVPMQPKALEEVTSDFPHAYEQPMASTRPAMARGA